MTLDTHSDEHAFDALDRMARAPVALRPLVAAGTMHAGLALMASLLGYTLAVAVLDDLRAQLDHWRDTRQIDD